MSGNRVDFFISHAHGPGVGGVGGLALNRCYDLAWWVDAEEAALVGVQLAELAGEVGCTQPGNAGVRQRGRAAGRCRGAGRRGSTGFVERLVRGYRPRLRPMISFMISVVPPKMDCTRLSAQNRPTEYSRM
jgi:hypothetical protein